MEAIKKFIKAFVIFIKMYRYGFFFSESGHVEPDGTNWGFYRFNHKNVPAMFDINFLFGPAVGLNFAHLHGDDYRLKFDSNKEFVSVEKTVMVKQVSNKDWWRE